MVRRSRHTPIQSPYGIINPTGVAMLMEEAHIEGSVDIAVAYATYPCMGARS